MAAESQRGIRPAMTQAQANNGLKIDLKISEAVELRAHKYKDN